MVILHIGAFGYNIYSGIYVVAPQHIKMQQRIEQVAFVNITNVIIEGIDNQFEYTSDFNISDLPEPFSNIELVVFHGVYIPEYLKIYKQLKKLSIPYIIIPHGSLSVEALNKKKLKKILANLFLFNKFINDAISIQYLSERECRASDYGTNKFICTNGISIPKVKKNHFNDDKVVFTYIGRLDSYHKGLDLLIQAVAKKKIFLKKYNCKINIYGPDISNQATTVKKMIVENNVDDIIDLHDGVIGEEKEHILLDTDLFIQTSRFEGMPMGILEALSYGVPCIVTMGTTLGSLIEEYDAGWCSDTSVDAIALKLEEAIKNTKNWKIKSVNALKLIEEKFEWNKVCMKELEYYQYYINKI